MRVFLSAGEASGDAYGAALVRELREKRSGLTFEAVGGRRLAAEGAAILADSSTWGSIGIVQSVLVGLRAVGSYRAVKRNLSAGPPGLFVPIDFGFMNVKLARHAKSKGWRVLYFVPPASWKRDRQGGDLPAITDAISTPFPWSAVLLKAMGANAHWFGHPIKQILRDLTSRSASVATQRAGLAVLPGSRKHEIESNLPVIAQSVTGPVEFALAPSVNQAWFKAKWQSLRSDTQSDRYTVGDAAAVLTRAHAAVVCSGTATLEAALCRTPMVVIYRMSRAMDLEAKLLRLRRPKYVALPNIVLDRMAVPELIMESAMPERIRFELEAIVREGPEREAQLKAFEDLDVALGGDDAITRTAELALSLMPQI